MTTTLYSTARGIVSRVTTIALMLAASTASAQTPAIEVETATLKPMAKIDPRFQSYNVEMAEVIGARFWAPYAPDGSVPADRYDNRSPLHLVGNRRLRNLARALGPAYMRVSGTWANSTFFQDDDLPAREPPPGYKGVLTRKQWAQVLAFAKSVDARIVTSFPVSAGSRFPDGRWNPDNARRLLRFTRSKGTMIAAIQPINEPNLLKQSALPPDYNASDFARDNAAFASLIAQEAPGTKFAGPTTTFDAGNYLFHSAKGVPLTTEKLFAGQPLPKYDLFTFHFYTSLSRRCIPSQMAAKPEVALSDKWLAEADRVPLFYKGLRDRIAPGAPIWITEIGQAACGGDPWAKTFSDTFRYVDNMARVARSGVSAVFHNTLAASDYALIDDETLTPRPSYWAAVLWRRIMGETVLQTNMGGERFHVFAHCLRDRPGGVGLLALNLDRSHYAALTVGKPSIRYTLDAENLLGTDVRLNGKLLKLVRDHLPSFTGRRASAGRLILPPASITFLAVTKSRNQACVR